MVAAGLPIDDIQFREWNDPLGWMLAPSPAFASVEEMRFWELNVTFMPVGTSPEADAPVDTTPETYAHMRFLEANTQLPGYSEGADLAGSEGRGLTEF